MKMSASIAYFVLGAASLIAGVTSRICDTDHITTVLWFASSVTCFAMSFVLRPGNNTS